MGFLLNVEIVLVFLMLGLSLVMLNPYSIQAQQSNYSKDPKQIMKDFKDGKDVIQADLDTNFDQLLNVIEARLNFSSIDSHLSLASQYFAQGKPSEGLSELQNANHEWQNSSMVVVNTGDEISSIAKNNSLSITNSTRVILEHLGKIFVNMGAKAEDLRIKLASETLD